MRKLLTTLVLSALLTSPVLAGNPRNSSSASIPNNRPVSYQQDWEDSITNYSYEYDNPCYCPKPENILNDDKSCFDYYQTPEETRQRKKGDCEDLSIELYDRLKRKGHNVRIVMGKIQNQSDQPQIYHVWVELKNKQNEKVILDPGFKIKGTAQEIQTKYNSRYVEFKPVHQVEIDYVNDMRTVLNNMFK